MTNLESLGLGGNQIVDISALSGLSNLAGLDLENNEIVDISALSGLTNLAELDLNENQIVDISALSGLTNLDSLGLAHNLIADIRPLVDNAGIGNGDDVALDHNSLNTQSGSPNRMALVALRQRGVSVTQKEDCDTCGD